MEPLVFRSSIHWSSGVLLTVLSFFSVLMPTLGFIYEDLGFPEIIAAIVVMIIGVGMFWILIDTKYTFKGDYLHYCSGPIRGKIHMETIHAIEHQKGWYCKSFLKPSLDYNGVYIYYNKFDDIYLSPKDKSEFVNYLLTTNPKILIKDNKPE
jgi:hypothetical protein